MHFASMYPKDNLHSIKNWIWAFKTCCVCADVTLVYHPCIRDEKGDKNTKLDILRKYYQTIDLTKTTPPCISGITFNLMFCFLLGTKVYVKRNRSKEEVGAVEKHMMHFILSCRVPGKRDSVSCLLAEPQALKNRDCYY